MTPRGNRAGGDDARDRRRDERAPAPKRSGESGRAQAQGGPRRDRNGAGRPPAADQRSGSGRDRDERRGSTGQRAATGRADRSSAGRPTSGSKTPARQGPKVAGRPRQAPTDPPRSVARDVLRAVRERDAYANLVLPALLRERGLAGRDAALATELAYGACRSLGLLDAVIAEGAGLIAFRLTGFGAPPGRGRGGGGGPAPPRGGRGPHAPGRAGAGCIST
ncbi:transcription antitermination factor NusB, partial [Nocardia abscessus]|uniref:transcription antitermination factor NusB n=1 Tax=Nocardia abscessus TaxID=120957 RepID=UPI00313BE3E6